MGWSDPVPGKQETDKLPDRGLMLGTTVRCCLALLGRISVDYISFYGKSLLYICCMTGLATIQRQLGDIQMQFTFTIFKHMTCATLYCAFLFIFSNSVTAQGVLEEIVVTAQKREQSLQDVPIAVAAITGNTIRKRAIAQGRELLD